MAGWRGLGLAQDSRLQEGGWMTAAIERLVAKDSTHSLTPTQPPLELSTPPDEELTESWTGIRDCSIERTVLWREG
jgi:hypothetical protein